MSAVKMRQGEDGEDWEVWIQNDESFRDPADDPNSLVIGLGPTLEAAWASAAIQLRRHLDTAAREQAACAGASAAGSNGSSRPDPRGNLR